MWTWSSPGRPGSRRVCRTDCRELTSKEKRTFKFSEAEKNGPKQPAPGHCQPEVCPKNSRKADKPPEGFLSYKKFADQSAEKAEYVKQKKLREKEFAQEAIAKLSIDPKDIKNPVPVPVAYPTFSKMALEQSRDRTGSQKKGLGFGVGPRMPLTDQERWVNKVRRYNINSAKTIDTKTDAHPGPPAYSLICHWAGKRPHKEKENAKEEQRNHLRAISRGPAINPYYARNL